MTQSLSARSSFSLQQILKILVRRRRILVICSTLSFSCLAARVFYERLFHPIYSGSLTLLTSSPINSASTQAASSLMPSLQGSASSINMSSLLEVLKSVAVREDINRQFISQFPDTPLPTLEIGNPPSKGQAFSQSSSIVVSSESNVAKHAQAYLGIALKVFLDWSLEERIKNLQNGLLFLDQQEPDLKNKLAAVESKRQKYSAKYNTLDPVVELQALATSVAERQSEIQQLSQVRSQLIDSKNSLANAPFRPLSFSASVTSNAAGSTGQAAGSASTSIGYSSILQLASKDDAALQEFVKLEQTIANARSIYAPSSSYLKTLLSKRAALIPSLQQKQASVLNDAITKVSQDLSISKSAYNSAKNRTRQLVNSLAEYNPIISEKTLLASSLDELIKSKQSFRLQLAQNSSNWQILSPPRVSPIPVSPKIPAALLQALFISLALGSFVSYVRDRLDVVFHNDSELQDELDLPLLAHIPYIGALTSQASILTDFTDIFSAKANNSADDHIVRFYFQESFRNLVTSLRFSTLSPELSTLAITSSIPSEGKSTITALLAKTYSDFGSRVLLIDADMRLPQLHKRLNLNNLCGLSNILTANTASWLDCVQHPDAWPNVAVITAGIIPPDPARLLASDAMKQLILDIKNSHEFDLILIDLPPVMGLSDSVIAASYFDSVALVVSLGKVDRRLPRLAINRIQECSSRCIGIIGNQILPGKSPSASSYAGLYGYVGRGYESSFLNKYFKGAMDPGSAAYEATAYNYSMSIAASPERQPALASVAQGKSKAKTSCHRNLLQNLRAFGIKLKAWLDA